MPEPGSNLDAYDRSDDSVVNPIPGAPLEAPVFFTIDAATAAGFPAIPAPGGPAVPGPNDILAFNPAVAGPVIWAFGAALGLAPGDNIDALAVQYVSGIPLPPLGPGWAAGPAGDTIAFSLAPGSASLAASSGGGGVPPLMGCAGAGTGTAGDLFYVVAPVGPGGALMYINAEGLGLDTVRSGGPADDNLDAVDFCNGLLFADFDLDFIDNGCDPDIDGDGIGNGIDPDDDGDGFADVAATDHEGPANTDTAVDNCVGLPNPAQTNTDGNFVDQTPPASVDDRSWNISDAMGDACDTDDDNDGLSDAAETGGPPCGTASGATDPLDADSDGDRVIDGPECSLGTDPDSSASFPTPAACGSTLDPDGDKLSDRLEVCYYNTDPALTDTDGDAAPALDGARDGCEVASLNVDRGVVNSGDQGILAVAVIGGVPAYHVNLDLNKDGTINSGDQGILASVLITAACP
jgi:hypothetical protein